MQSFFYKDLNNYVLCIITNVYFSGQIEKEKKIRYPYWSCLLQYSNPKNQGYQHKSKKIKTIKTKVKTYIKGKTAIIDKQQQLLEKQLAFQISKATAKRDLPQR